MALGDKPISNLDANQVAQYGFDENSQAHRTITVANLVNEEFDHITLTYVAAGNGAGEIETVTYRNGGAGGTVVATLTLAYDASNNLVTVARS